MKTFNEAFQWLLEPLRPQKRPHALLGNGFSMALDPSRFSYSALATAAEADDLLPADAINIMQKTSTVDFEKVIRQLEDTAHTLKILAASNTVDIVARLLKSSASLREALAQSIAGLHPDRPYDIEQSRYISTRDFLNRFDHVFTVNYDLLLYWSIMQDLPGHSDKERDDGFRDSGVDGDETVLWDIYSNFSQTVFYLHGALHLFLGTDGLRKITWKRTDIALIDQVRQQLKEGRFPLYVAEGDAESKLDKINRSAYLSRGLRSLTQCGGSLLIYGHSLAKNDAHIFQAVVRGKYKRAAISIYGDPNSDDNKEIMRRARGLVADRSVYSSTNPLEVEFFNAAEVRLWKPA
ncbi:MULTISPECIES: DUF4917 family protein [Saccharothrix]|uniref:DUF4917 family protein n=1 Tax=Saccharothrix TaxID=2071 RepID=UPI00093D76DC|nr:DUF4917 family protein [Saccharothrix sp. CB00851]